ncbi:amidohydrolase family protein [Cesiribacter sp. SM1]|uniref:N-acyl-D-amino-acid deacylase family protein n=1 Tax=Cesiribacter sp. SM1 TaxID=2861196 RepID=UPI001CD292DC|nr:amidohydrolase family protein [Cesiribacter sp. SM1]
MTQLPKIVLLHPLSCLLLLWTISACTPQKTATAYDLLITQATVVDGTGEAPYVANVVISGDSIVLIDHDTTAAYLAKETINAQGLVLSPGFIDTHAHGDPLKTPDFKNFLSMGVTTISLGQDGFSPEHENPEVWMDSVSAIKPGTNIALFAGHNTLRLLSGTGYTTTPSAENIAAMERLLHQAIEAGCFGLTTGLEYTPGYYADSAELNQLARVAGARGGIIMSHMRNEDDSVVDQSIRELLAQGKYCPVHISHIKVVYGKGSARAAEILQLMDSARSSGIQLTADLYPYTASYTGIAILFPDWAKKPNNYQQVLSSRRAELSQFLVKKIWKRNGPEATLIGSGPYKGKTLAQISAETNKPFEEVLIDDIGPYGASGAYFIMDSALQDAFLTDPHIMISTDGSPTMNHPRGYGTFAKVIESYVVEKNLLSLQEAVRKMSGLPAQTLGLTDRGLIREGYKADILLFDPKAIRERATYEDPYQLASGFQYVVVNGKVIKRGENFTPERAGRMLKKNAQNNAR